MRAAHATPVVVLLGLAACEPAEPAAERAPQPAAAPAPAPAPSVELANDLSMIATGVPATAADLTAIEAAGGGVDAFHAYIEQLITRGGLARVLYGALRLRPRYVRFDWAMAPLQSQVVDGDEIYFIREACPRTEARKVHPWWALDTEVLVCPSSYKPDVFKSTRGDYCSGFIAGPGREPSCGCGPNLIRCYIGDGLKTLIAAAIAEGTDTVAYVVDNDLPVQTLFSGRNTYRGGAGELIYQRWSVENQIAASLEAFPDWRKWPAKGKWAPRPQMRQHQHAGLLTSQSLLAPDSARNRLEAMYGILWCQEFSNQHVDAHALLNVAKAFPTNDLRRRAGNETLARTEPCTKCHARLESGTQFFAGSQWAWHVDHYIAAAQLDTVGELYAADIDDPRGKAPMNPEGFARLAMAQPEFPTCMAKRITTAVFGGDPADHADLLAELEAIVARRGTLREMARLALRRYAAERLARPADAVAGGAGSLRAMVDQHCSDCHDADDGQGPGDIVAGGDTWCANTADCAGKSLRMLDVVASKVMPKSGGTMTTRERLQLIDLLAPTAFPDRDRRALALTHFRRMVDGRPLHNLGAVMQLLHTQATAGQQAPPAPFAFSQLYFSTRFDTTTAVRSAITVTSGCAGAQDRRACVERVFSDPEVFFK